MPETRFQIQWPDASHEVCYSPSSIIKKYLIPGQEYELEDFVERARTALNIASDRVEAKYGRPCGLALGQIQSIEDQADRYRRLPLAKVRVLGFV